MRNITIDFEKKCKKIKPLHGVCCAPYEMAKGEKQVKIDDYFRRGNIPFCRLHDCGGAYGKGCLVDVTNIFPDFSADENDPNSYNFHYTDEYIGAIEKTGCRTYYRLGESIEWGSLKRTSLMPADFDKWARICEHIIRHYNEGWADGFHYDIKYWEIWNEPENPGNEHGPSQWSGSKEKFFQLYEIASKHLKSRFPDIKIGGYGSCGFYTVTGDDVPESYKEFVTFFRDFLKMVKQENCPLDFFSWHIYTNEVAKLVAHAEFVRRTLDDYGFENTEVHLNEWNINSEGEGFADKHTSVGASFLAAVLAKLQKTDYVDMAMYYCFQYESIYNGFVNRNTNATDTAWYAFEMFGRLYELGDAAFADSDDQELFAVAATDGKKSAAVVSNYGTEDVETEISLHYSGEKTVTLSIIDDTPTIREVCRIKAKEGLSFSYQIRKNSVLLIETK